MLQLSVVSDNEPARRLYTRLGFVEYGVEKNSLKQHGRYYDEILMALTSDPIRIATHFPGGTSRPVFARNSPRRAPDNP